MNQTQSPQAPAWPCGRRRFGMSSSQQGCTATETFVHAMDGRAANPLVLGALVDELVNSEAVEGDSLHSLIAAVASSGDNRLWDDLASPLPRPSAAPYPQLAALAS